MSQSIGMLLGSMASLSPQSVRTHPGARVSPASTPSFADQLDASFRTRAKRLGLELPQPAAAEHAPSEAVEAVWARVQRADAARNGLGDAIMRSLAEAADARHEQREGCGRDLFDL